MSDDATRSQAGSRVPINRVRTDTGPHEFYALRWIDGRRDNGRCRHCFLPRSAHPVMGWVEARPMWNMRKADRG